MPIPMIATAMSLCDQSSLLCDVCISCSPAVIMAWSPYVSIDKSGEPAMVVSMSNRNVIVTAIKAAISAIEKKTGEPLSNYQLEKHSMLNHKVWDRIRNGCPDRMTHSNIMRAAEELGVEVKPKLTKRHRFSGYP